MRELADYGEARRPPADSVLAQAVTDARAYADHLESDLSPVVIWTQGTSQFATADALAELIVGEVESGAYGDPSPPPGAQVAAFPWVPVGIAVGVGLLIAACVRQKRGLFSQGSRKGVLAAVGL